jgi:hypothetical protein
MTILLKFCMFLFIKPIFNNTHGASKNSETPLQRRLSHFISTNFLFKGLRSSNSFLNQIIINCWRLIQEIRQLLSLDWEIIVCHSYRKANACADALANMGCEHGPELRVYDQCPASLISLLQADVMGITTPRVISV